MNHALETVVKSPFWKPNIGHVVLAAMILIGYGRVSERFETVAVKQVQDESEIKLINDTGTNFSKAGIKMEEVTLEDHTQRIRKMEDLVSSMGVLKEKIDRISEDVRDIKTRGK